jgi:hypothetical protein
MGCTGTKKSKKKVGSTKSERGKLNIKYKGTIGQRKILQPDVKTFQGAKASLISMFQGSINTRD